MVKVGVLSLQGAVREHLAALTNCGCVAIPVRLPQEVAEVGGLVIPGGESTTIGKLMTRFGVEAPIVSRALEGMPILGTCAGMILLAKDIVGSDQPRLGLMDISVRRNAFGRQIDSFETDLVISGIEGGPCRAVFIRAPYIESVGPGVEVLAEFEGRPVLARQGNLIACAFHPELTRDPRLHRWFCGIVKQATDRPAGTA